MLGAFALAGVIIASAAFYFASETGQSLFGNESSTPVSGALNDSPDNSDDDDSDQETTDDSDESPPVAITTPEATNEVDNASESDVDELSDVERGELIDPEATETPDTTPTEAVSPTSPPPQSEPTPDPAAIVGEFGELPRGEIPTGGPADQVTLDFSLEMSLQNIPSQASAFRMQSPEWTTESVREVASNLGVEGEVIEQGNNSYRIDGPQGSLYFANMVIQYINYAEYTPAPLPGLNGMITAGRNWLINNQLISADLGEGEVRDTNEANGIANVVFKPVEPAGIISATPAATLTVRADGTIGEARISWPGILESSTYGFRSANDMWSDVAEQRAYLELNHGQIPPEALGANGTVDITSATIAYTLAGTPEIGQYLIPVLVFEGSAIIEGIDGTLPIRVYTQALGAQAVPRG